MYIELLTASAFSFLRGASLPEALVDRAAALEYPALALVDRDGLYGIPRFHKAAIAAGIKPIVGAELSMADGGGRVPAASWSLPVLVASQAGYRNLSRLITRMKLRAPKGEGALTLDDLDGHVEGLEALPGRALVDVKAHGVGGLLDRLVGLFGRGHVHVVIERHLDRAEAIDNQWLADLAAAYRVPIVAAGGVRFATPAERPLHDVFTCLRHKTTLAQAGRRLAANAERYLKSPSAMAEAFADLPQALRATEALAGRIEYTMADLGYRFPPYPVPPGETMISFLRAMTELGARDRYRPYHDRARAQIARELDLIEKLDLAGYFLIVWDVINFCRQRGILVQGRGSAANSAVCYSLGITAVDPVGMELLFERFLSEERGEWPDIDLDLPSGDRREQAIQYVYERYGKLGAAMTANVITYRGRSATRDVGKALGLDAELVDRLAKLMHRFEYVDSGETLARHLGELGVDGTDPRMRQFSDLWHRMQDLPRHLGQHSGGMVICQDRLDQVVPLENASMPGRVVVQWDKEDCADMGLIKVDLLGLGMMSVLQDALAIVNSSSFVPRPSSFLDLARLPPDDAQVYRMLREADTIGLFQVESRAQMATLPRLKPACFYDLVVQVAIIRPGPIVGQMVHPYLNRRAGREPVTYAHPSLEPILKRTLGVPLFQEQLLRMAMVAAGFTGGQAEELRRAMGFKRSEKRMRVIEQQLREGMARQGITGEAADQIVASIASFALYGFPESHAASFAHIAYASAYLKAHYPAVFYTALLNNQPMGFYHPATLVKDAQRHGVHFAPIDVEASRWDCVIAPDGRVRLGLRYVTGLREQVGRAIEATRPQPPAPPARCPKCGCDDRSMLEIAEAASGGAAGVGPSWSGFCNLCAHDWIEPQAPARRFASPEDLIRKTGARRDELAALSEIGALSAFGCDRRAALWQIEKAVRPEGELFERRATSDERRATHDERRATHDERRATNDERRATHDERRATHDERRATNDERRATNDERRATHDERRATHDERRATHDERRATSDERRATYDERRTTHDERRATSPLPAMTAIERMAADFAGTGLTIGPHPMSFHRPALALKGVLRAVDLPGQRSGRRVRVAGCVITRQRPGTAKGFVFLTLEDETGISNVIVRPQVYEDQRLAIIESSFVVVEGLLQQQDGVTAVKAERVLPLQGIPVEVESHDFR